jgi:hypothetical protein
MQYHRGNAVSRSSVSLRNSKVQIERQRKSGNQKEQQQRLCKINSKIRHTLLLYESIACNSRSSINKATSAKAK